MRLPAFIFISVFVVGAWLPFVKWHVDVYGEFNIKHALLTLFNAVNILICFWEMSLHIYQSDVQATYRKLKRRTGGDRVGVEILFIPSCDL